jgi:hypothetical protein
MLVRTFQAGDELAQAGVFNAAACTLPGFKPAQADEVRRRTRGRGFDPGTRFYAEADGQVVGYCALDPDEGRVSFPWCKKGHEEAGPLLFEAALNAARGRGLGRVFAAYRHDWHGVFQFLAGRGFAHARDVVNYWCDPVELPTAATRGGRLITRLDRSELPALAEMGRGVIRVPLEKLEKHLFDNPYFPAESLLALRSTQNELIAVAIGLESPSFADVRKTDPLAPCFRLGAFGTEGLNAKRVNGLFSFLVSRPDQTVPAGLGLLAEACGEMTEGTVNALAAQCPSDAPHLVNFYARYFKEHGRFPVWERDL